MTIRNIPIVVNTNTFDTWKNRTNEIITSLSDVATLGGLTANNDAELYISDNIKTTGGLYSDELYPLDGATNRITVGTLASSPVLRTFMQEIFVPEGGIQNAIQFRFGETTADETYALGTGVDSDSFRITAYYPGDVGVDPITSYLEIQRSDTRDPLTSNANPGIITASNLEIDDNILPAQLRFSNAATASVWETPRVLTFSDDFNASDTSQAVPVGEQGDVAGVITIDGSANLTCYLKVRNDSHLHDTRYYTKTQIDNNFETTTSGDGRYVKVAPEENIANPGQPASDFNGYILSEIEQGGVAFRDDINLIFGSNYTDVAGNDAVYMSYNRIGQQFIMRQVYGNMSISAGQQMYFKQADPTGGVDVTKIQFDLGTGNIVATGDVTAYGSLSDINLKDDLEIIPNALEKVSQINGYTFHYKKDEPGIRSTGLVAQELEKVLPEAVYEIEDFDNEMVKSIRYGNVVGLLVEAIKELKQEIETLKSK